MDKLADEVDLVILLAHIPKWRIKEVAEALSGVDIILGADSVSATKEIVEINGARISYCGSQGQFLGVLSFQLENGGRLDEFEHKMIRVETTMPVDEEIKLIVQKAEADIRQDS